MPGRWFHHSFTPAQRKEALGPVLYLGPTYSVPTLLAVSKRFDKTKKMLVFGILVLRFSSSFRQDKSTFIIPIGLTGLTRV